eukprot:scaffold11520_cov175-Isochrysis_galbana.AAC.3
MAYSTCYTHSQIDSKCAQRVRQNGSKCENARCRVAHDSLQRAALDITTSHSGKFCLQPPAKANLLAWSNAAPTVS